MKRGRWYVSLGMAIGCYCGLKYGSIALLAPGHRLLELFEMLAPLTAMAWLLLAGKQLYDTPEAEDDRHEHPEKQDPPEAS